MKNKMVDLKELVLIKICKRTIKENKNSKIINKNKMIKNNE